MRSPETLANRLAYREATPKQFGTLHQRMKYLIDLAIRDGIDSTHFDIWNAIFDLKTEVENYPSHKSYGRSAK